MFHTSAGSPYALFGDLDRLHRSLSQALAGRGSDIRSGTQGAFPSVNIGRTATAVEIYAFLPGVAPDRVEVNLDRGLLSISGERDTSLPAAEGEKRTTHAQERTSGKFRRTISLPDNIDPARVSARYRHGVLQISAPLRESAQPRRIDIQGA
ncbi:MAG: Hsp20/alpha crystallin family protein [Corticimicrobacter sp.]|uniref:Hsp20/alpha crystallin family protein n=1 Tax=Corticimicrobacter sp. TaxID=2678536 RepID=UPI0032DA5EAE